MLSELVSDVRYRVRTLFRRHAVEQELDDELALHLEASSMHVFVPFLQVRRPSRFTTYIVIRAKPERLASATEEMHRELTRVLTGTQRLRETVTADRIPSELRPWRLSATIFTTAGLLALLVASIGVYSVISYTFGQRTHEIGVRIALGAPGKRVARLVVGEGVRVVAAGVCIGASIVLTLGKVVASALYGTTPRDPVVLIGSALTLTIVSVIACMVPAWRAMRVDPIQALRSE
jgi:putative ABC transport system permease protein